MKYLLIIFSFILLISNQSLANSIIGKGASCEGYKIQYYYYFHETDKYEHYVLENGKLNKKIYNYTHDLNTIFLELYEIDRKTLDHRGKNNHKKYGMCKVYSSFTELSKEIKRIIDKASSENQI